jgi:copper chaperone NosL
MSPWRFTGLRLPKPTGQRLLLGALLVLACLPMYSCQKAPLKPVDIAKDELCTRCRSIIEEKRYAAEFITKDGFVRKFDDITCMVQHAKNKVKKENIEAYFMVDFTSQQWVTAQEAKYVRSDKFKTPKDGGILAFKDAARAQALASQYQADWISFDDLMK